MGAASMQHANRRRTDSPGSPHHERDAPPKPHEVRVISGERHMRGVLGCFVDLRPGVANRQAPCTARVQTVGVPFVPAP